MLQPRDHISLYELLSSVRKRLDEAFALPLWVAAEVSELKVNYSGHCYMELIEKSEGDKLPRAKCTAIVWRSQWAGISSYFTSATGQQIGPGVKVLFKASLNFHEAYGFSLVISDIDPTFTLGEMERQRRETIARLEKDGVFDMNRELEMPFVVQRVAVVSSRNAAGYQDFYRELEASPYRFDITLFDAYMQGAETEASVVDALEKIAERMEDFDAVAIIRGGGAQSDLAAFDSYRLCNHVAQFPLPVITGIGHDKDQSVADLVAAVSLKTPTAVARWLIDGLERVDRSFADAALRIADVATAFLTRQSESLQRHALLLAQFTSSFTRALELQLERYAGELVRRPELLMAAQRARLDNYRSLLSRNVAARFAAERSRLDVARAAVEGRDPARILHLGFSLVRHEGKIVRNAAELAPGSRIDIALGKGSAEATVDKVKKNK